MSTPAYAVTEARFRDHAPDILSLWTNGLAGVTPASAHHKLEHGYFANPAGEGRCIVLTTPAVDHPIGVQCLHIRRFSIDDRTWQAASLADYVVSAEHRSLGPALQMLKYSVALGLGAYDLVYGMPNKNALAVCKRVGLQHIGLLKRYGRLLKLRFVFRNNALPLWFKLVAPLGDTLLGGVDRLLRSVHAPGMSARDIAWPAAEIDTLWQQRPRSLLLCERTSQTLAWRYGPDPQSHGWHLTLLSRRHQPIGYVVWRKEQDIALVSDYFCLDPASRLRSILLAFCCHARRHDTCAISLEFLGTPEAETALRQSGFIAKEGGAPVMFQLAPGRPPLTPEQVYFTSFERDLN